MGSVICVIKPGWWLVPALHGDCSRALLPALLWGLVSLSWLSPHSLLSVPRCVPAAVPAGCCARDSLGIEMAILCIWHRMGMAFATCAEPWRELLPVQTALMFVQVSAALVGSEIPGSEVSSVIFLLSLLCLLTYS